MNDRTWILNPAAIKAAKECINLVKKELGVKLLLSHPEFTLMLHEYVELTDSTELKTAYSRLIAFAGPGTIIKTLGEEHQNVVPLKSTGTDGAIADDSDGGNKSPEETVTYGSKQYPRWRDGKEFSGLYRGQPNYS